MSLNGVSIAQRAAESRWLKKFLAFSLPGSMVLHGIVLSVGLALPKYMAEDLPEEEDAIEIEIVEEADEQNIEPIDEVEPIEPVAQDAPEPEPEPDSNDAEVLPETVAVSPPEEPEPIEKSSQSRPEPEPEPKPEEPEPKPEPSESPPAASTKSEPQAKADVPQGGAESSADPLTSETGDSESIGPSSPTNAAGSLPFNLDKFGLGPGKPGPQTQGKSKSANQSKPGTTKQAVIPKTIKKPAKSEQGDGERRGSGRLGGVRYGKDSSSKTTAGLTERVELIYNDKGKIIDIKAKESTGDAELDQALQKDRQKYIKQIQKQIKDSPTGARPKTIRLKHEANYELNAKEEAQKKQNEVISAQKQQERAQKQAAQQRANTNPIKRGVDVPVTSSPASPPKPASVQRSPVAPKPQPVVPKPATPKSQPLAPKSQPATPKPAAPKPVAPKPIAPRPIVPQPVVPKPVVPQQRAVPKPQPVAPRPVAPKPVAPKPVAPKPAAPPPALPAPAGE